MLFVESSRYSETYLAADLPNPNLATTWNTDSIDIVKNNNPYSLEFKSLAKNTVSNALAIVPINLDVSSTLNLDRN